MLQARDHRQKIQDIAFERREALAAQAEDGLYEGKERFATAAYKQKLQEDKLYAEQLESKYAAFSEHAFCACLPLPMPRLSLRSGVKCSRTMSTPCLKPHPSSPVTSSHVQ
jgi:hypothetical protein